MEDLQFFVHYLILQLVSDYFSNGLYLELLSDLVGVERDWIPPFESQRRRVRSESRQLHRWETLLKRMAFYILRQCVMRI